MACELHMPTEKPTCEKHMRTNVEYNLSLLHRPKHGLRVRYLERKTEDLNPNFETVLE